MSFPISIKEKKPSYFYLFVCAYLVVILIMVSFSVYFNSRYFRVRIIGDSMENTLIGAEYDTDLNNNLTAIYAGGNYVYADRFKKPERGDIAILKCADGTVIVKRIIALGGDSIYISEGTVILNNQRLEEPYVSPKNNKYKENRGEIVIPKGRVYFLGDNRDVSKDSRGPLGTLPEDSVLGVVTGWSMTFKGVISAFYNYFDFYIYGVNRRTVTSS